jgi:hypothetical protein
MYDLLAFPFLRYQKLTFFVKFSSYRPEHASLDTVSIPFLSSWHRPKPTMRIGMRAL